MVTPKMSYLKNYYNKLNIFIEYESNSLNKSNLKLKEKFILTIVEHIDRSNNNLYLLPIYLYTHYLLIT